MGMRRINLAFENAFYSKMEKVAKKRGFKNTVDYVYDLVRRSIYSAKLKSIKKIDPYLGKFATPTKETYKIAREVGGIV